MGAVAVENAAEGADERAIQIAGANMHELGVKSAGEGPGEIESSGKNADATAINSKGAIAVEDTVKVAGTSTVACGVAAEDTDSDDRSE